MCESSVTDPAASADVLSDCLLPSAHRPLSNAAASRVARTWPGWSRLETGPRYQQNCSERHKEKTRPIRSEPQESQAAPWRLQSIASGPGRIPAAKWSPPNSGACHVQDSADNEERAKSHQEHSRLLFVAAPHNTTVFKHPGSKTFRPSAVIQQVADRLESGLQTKADVHRPL
jgi:hypothetical protein